MNARKFTVADLEVEEDRRPTYVSLDAKWLDDLSRDLGDEHTDFHRDRDEDLIRLRVIAERHEKLDEKFRNVTAKASGETAEDILRSVLFTQDSIEESILPAIIGRLKSALTADAYSAGIIEGKRRYLERSNLPLQSVELTDELRQAIARSPMKPRRVEQPNKGPKPPKVSELSLNGIRLNLAGLK